MKSIKMGIIYIFSAIFGVASALGLTVHLVKKTWAQDAPQVETSPPQTPPPSQDLASPSAGSGKENISQLKKGETPSMKQLSDIDTQNKASNASPTVVDPNLAGADTDENYIYNPEGKRDPFEPYTYVETAAPVVIRVNVEDPLLKYDLDMYEVTGVIWGSENSKAFIKTPEKKFFTLYKGDKLGNNNGVIVGFREGLIVVQEVQNDTGIPVSVLRKLSIQGSHKKGDANE